MILPPSQEAISVIETDCEVDFAPPLDYVEPAAAAPVEEPMEDDGAPGPSGEQTAPEEPRFTVCCYYYYFYGHPCVVSDARFTVCFDICFYNHSHVATYMRLGV